MILNKDFNWYLKIVKPAILIVGGWIIFIGLVGRIPVIGWVFGLISLPLTWILRIGGAGYVGYQTVKKFQGTTLQALVSGGIFGAGIGLASVLLFALRMIFRLNLANLFFGPMLLISTILNEAITGLVVSFIGGIIAGSPAKTEKKK